MIQVCQQMRHRSVVASGTNSGKASINVEPQADEVRLLLGSRIVCRNDLMPPRELNAIREQLLVLQAQGRDPVAFRELVVLYDRRILYYVRRILSEDSDGADVLQEIWMKVFLRINTLRAPEAFRVWLYKIAHDVSVSHLRKRRQDRPHPLSEELVSELAETSDWNELELLEEAALVHAALAQLSLAHREIITLRFLEELDLAEIADIVGCEVGTVKSRLHYAKVALRKLLEVAHHD